MALESKHWHLGPQCGLCVMDASLDPLALPCVPSLVFLSTRELRSLRLSLTTAKQEEHMGGLCAVEGIFSPSPGQIPKPWPNSLVEGK